jgi:putative ABC transport system permease protein
MIAALLFGTSPVDPVVYAAGAVTLMLVAAAACCVPAYRAVRIDPAIALRAE